MILEAEHLHVSLVGRPILTDISLTLGEGDWLMLVGPNGAGKSTLIGALSRSVRSEGALRLDGQDLRALRPAALARTIGVMAQTRRAEYAFTVEEYVRMGRYPWREGFLRVGDPDGGEAAEEALRLTGLTELRDRSLLTLSGGELQRAALAQVFCQRVKILMLDEPANHLDLQYMRQICELIDGWRRQPGHAVLSVMHDLSLARRWGTHALLLDQGRCAGFGPAREVMTDGALARVWQMDVAGWMRELYGQWQEE